MAANPEKQNLRYKKTDERQQKTSYAGLSADEAKYIKASQRHELIAKEMDRLWARYPRTEGGAVDWSKLSEQELSLFEHVQKELKRTAFVISRLEDKVNVHQALSMFRQRNTRSQSY